MCIGFSFTGVISSLLSLMQYGIMVMKKTLQSHKLSKSVSQNGSTKIKTNYEKGERSFTNYNSKIYNCNDLKYLKEGLDNLEEKVNTIYAENRHLKQAVDEISKKIEDKKGI